MKERAFELSAYLNNHPDNTINGKRVFKFTVGGDYSVKVCLDGSGRDFARISKIEKRGCETFAQWFIRSLGYSSASRENIVLKLKQSLPAFCYEFGIANPLILR